MASAERSTIGRSRIGARGAPARRWAWAGLGGVLAGALALRLWGIGQGLPYVYNIDESDHFVPRAIAMFGHSLNPHYFENPPAFTYLLHVLFAVWFGGGAGAAHAYGVHPADVYIVGRASAAVLGTLAIWLLYLVGARLFGRGVGLLAAAVQAVAFLPVFYAHLALNDVPTLAPVTLSLLGTAGVLRRGRLIDYLLAGVGLGLACATKYTGGIVLLPLIAACAARYLDREPGRALGGGRQPVGLQVMGGVALAGLCALVAFLIANPYAVLDFHGFHAALVHQSTASGEAQGKLGAPKEWGVLYYLWSLTWGLGWVPALAALGGGLTIWRFEARLGWLLVPAPLLFLAFMGFQGRYFGRWLLPIFPFLCLLAAFFALTLADVLARRIASGRARGTPRRPRRPPSRLRALLVAAVVVALCAQGAVYSIHSGMLLSRADTRNVTRAWMVAHVPQGARIVVEPVAPNGWVRDVPGRHGGTARGGGDASSAARWNKYASLVSVISPDGELDPSARRVVGIEDYVRTLSPALIGWYERGGYCWVVSGSTESGRAFADPGSVPHAVAYYRALAQQASVAYRASPYARGHGPVAFGFDWSFDYYPLAYYSPGPAVTVYRLHGGRCGG